MLSVTLALAVDVAPPVQLERLARLYLAYELPLPPKDAKLVRYAPDGKTFPMPVRVGFEVRPKTEGNWGMALFGCETDTVYPQSLSELRPEPKAVAAADVSLPTAIQFHLRGWKVLAVAVFAGKDWEGRAPEDMLAVYALRYWERRLGDPTADRATVARRLRALRNAEPRAFADADREFHDDLLRSLRVSQAMPGTVEADIDELLDVSEQMSAGWCGDRRYSLVVARGFDAVPALIHHLSDTRLTRAGLYGLVPHWTRLRDYRVRHFASDLLVGLLHDGEAKTTDEGVVRAKDARAWWEKAAKEGEEAFAVARVLKAKGDKFWPNPHLLLLLERKYPERLPEVFLTLLADHPKMGLEEMAAAVAESSLPTETKRELFTRAAESKKEEWQQVGRERLKELGEKK